MSIRLKVARSEKELDDVFRLRHQVYVAERGKFSSVRNGGQHIVDRYDAIPGVAIIVAYEGDTAIASMRVNRDSAIGLPAEEYFDFWRTRTALWDAHLQGKSDEPVLVSGSMLATHRQWRNRRNVIFALFKMAAGVMYDWGATHVIGSISEETLSLYGRIGFEAIGEPEWNEAVRDSLVPILAPFDKVFEWTYGSISDRIAPFWLNNFCGKFERLLLSPGESLFHQGETAEHAYAIDEGWISISRKDGQGNEMVLANLSRGALLGELAILDEEPRSATATAITNASLIVLERQHLMDLVREHPEKLGQLLRHLTRRVRDMDDLSMVQAFAPETKRVVHALNRLWRSADTDPENPAVRVARVAPEQIARSAQIREDELMRVLETEKSKGVLDFGRRRIRFFREPGVDDPFERDVG